MMQKFYVKIWELINQDLINNIHSSFEKSLEKF